MTTTKVADFKIDVKDIDRVYSGKRGCMCGCNGNYYENNLMNNKVIRRAINKFNQSGEYKLDVNLSTGEIGNYVFLETETRIHVVYFSDSFNMALKC